MTAPFPSLVRLYILSLYAPARRSDGAKAAKPSAKKIAKTIGIAFLAVLLAGDIGSIFVAMNLTMYAALKPAGLQGLLLLNAATTASAFVFILGFLTAISTYCMSQADSGLLALPIRGRSLLGAKMAMVYLSEFAFAFFLVLVASIIYAIKEAPPASFYFDAVLTAAAVPLVPLAAIYLIVVPLMAALKPLRSKNAAMILGAVIGIAFAVIFNIYIQGIISRLNDNTWILSNFAGPNAILAQIGLAYPPAFLAWKSMSAGGLAGLGYGIASLIIGLGATACVALALGKTYAKTLLGFDELRVKRMAATKAFMTRSFRRRRPLAALLFREIRLMNREPIYFINGPFIILLMPIILAVIAISQKSRLGDLIAQAGGFVKGPLAMLAAAGFGAFLGSSTSICSTAISRDAKALPYLKALPVLYRSLALAKFLHGFAFALFGAIVGGIGAGAALGLSFLECAGAFLLAAAFSSFACIAGLWLDTANPRLVWDNPTAALKQNPNSSILIVGVMALLGILGALSAILPWGKLAFFSAYFAAFSALALAALAAYPRYAEKRIREIES